MVAPLILELLRMGAGTALGASAFVGVTDIFAIDPGRWRFGVHPNRLSLAVAGDRSRVAVSFGDGVVVIDNGRGAVAGD